MNTDNTEEQIRTVSDNEVTYGSCNLKNSRV